MIDAISTSNAAMAAASTVQKQQNVGSEVGVNMLSKAMDTQSVTLVKLLQDMGIGNSINTQA